MRSGSCISRRKWGALSPEWIRSVLSASEYQAALDVLDENIDVIMGDEKLYAFWGKRI